MMDDSADTLACNCLALRQAARRVTQIYDTHLAATGLSTNQFSILVKLQRLGPQSINALAKQMVMDRTTLGRAIRPLERDGLVQVDAGEDARTRRLALTAQGRNRLKAAAAKWNDAQKAFDEAFGADNASSLRATLRRVVEHVGKEHA